MIEKAESKRKRGQGWPNKNIENFFLNLINFGLFLHGPFEHKLYVEENCRLMRDLNSDHWSIKPVRWPLNHCHVPNDSFWDEWTDHFVVRHNRYSNRATTNHVPYDNIFKNMGQSWPVFVYFRPYLIPTTNTVWSSTM